MTQTEAPQHSLDAEQAGYKQSLGRRHVQMIAIGGAIGTGLFLGSASRLHSTGPALLFSYAVRRRHRLLPDARPRRAGPAPRDVGRLRLLHARVLRREGRLRHRLDVLAELGADRHRRALGGRPLRPVLVPDHADLGDRADRARRRAGRSTCCRPAPSASSSSGRRSSRSARSWSSSSSASSSWSSGFDIGGHEAGFHNLWSNPGGFWPTRGPLQLVRPDPGHVRGRLRLRRHRDGRRRRR